MWATIVPFHYSQFSPEAIREIYVQIGKIIQLLYTEKNKIISDFGPNIQLPMHIMQTNDKMHRIKMVTKSCDIFLDLSK